MVGEGEMMGVGRGFHSSLEAFPRKRWRGNGNLSLLSYWLVHSRELGARALIVARSKLLSHDIRSDKLLRSES